MLEKFKQQTFALGAFARLALAGLLLLLMAGAVALAWRLLDAQHHLMQAVCLACGQAQRLGLRRFLHAVEFGQLRLQHVAECAAAAGSIDQAGAGAAGTGQRLQIGARGDKSDRRAHRPAAMRSASCAMLRAALMAAILAW